MDQQTRDEISGELAYRLKKLEQLLPLLQQEEPAAGQTVSPLWAARFELQRMLELLTTLETAP